MLLAASCVSTFAMVNSPDQLRICATDRITAPLLRGQGNTCREAEAG